MLQYAGTIFVSAFLLFQVQPLIARFILPWFGGTASVWSVTMLFFQTVLLGGYAYAHFSIARLKAPAQLGVHLALLGLSLIALPIIPDEALKPTGEEAPTLRIMLLLLLTVGLPYFALSATGPLLQAWFSRSYPKRQPYALYALSNVGSLLALLSYPFVFEPVWGRVDQAMNWTYGYVAFVVLCAVAAITAFVHTRRPREAAEPIPEPTPEPAPQKDTPVETPVDTRNHTLLWIAFAAAGSTLLLAYTNQLCMDIASVPFLWVVPLSLYLLSFIITFTGDRWYPRRVFLVLMVLAMGATTSLPLFQQELSTEIEILLLMASLFVFCMVCHGEAYRLRPEPARLTRFYLSISLGGVIGGFFVAIMAPLVFSLYNELPAGVLATGLLVLVALSRDPKSGLYGGQPRWAWGMLLIMAIGLSGGLGYSVYASLDETIYAGRSFYGVFRVKETPEGEHWERTLYSGTTMHGLQFMHATEQRIPTTYYGRHSGVGLVLSGYPEDAKLNIGVVGLGAGTLATYTKPGDHMRFYEINPHVVDLANDYFKYLENSGGTHDIVLGDARLQLELQEPQQFDVLVLDAFSSDSIPVHLLTAEAFEQYRRHIKFDGVICVHISNRYLDLRPVVARGADHIGMKFLGWHSGTHARTGTTAAEWVILTNNARVQRDFQLMFEAFLKRETDAGELDEWPHGIGSALDMTEVPDDFPMWTDDYSNMFRILR